MKVINNFFFVIASIHFSLQTFFNFFDALYLFILRTMELLNTLFPNTRHVDLINHE